MQGAWSPRGAAAGLNWTWDSITNVLIFYSVHYTPLKDERCEQIGMNATVAVDSRYSETEPAWVDQQLFIPEHFRKYKPPHLHSCVVAYRTAWVI